MRIDDDDVVLVTALDSAMTFQSSRFGSTIALMLMFITGGVPFRYWLRRFAPPAKVVNATGIVGTIGFPAASTKLPTSRSVRPGLPSLKMMTPDAPAAWALMRLHTEVAATTLDQSDTPRHETAEVGRGASARRAGRRRRRDDDAARGLNRSVRGPPMLCPGPIRCSACRCAGSARLPLKVGKPVYA